MTDPDYFSVIAFLPKSVRAMIDDPQSLYASACLEFKGAVMYIFVFRHFIVNSLGCLSKERKDTHYLCKTGCKDDILMEDMQPF